MADPVTPQIGSQPARRIALATALLGTLFAVASLTHPLSAHPHPAVAGTTAEAGALDGPQITFPVVGPVTFSDTWGACRGDGCSRSHKGVDIFGHKLAPLVAAADGVISSDRRSGLGLGGNLIVITDDNGWRYVYVHLNNDTPGTDDGANPQAWIVANGLRVGDRVSAGQVIGYLGDSGNAEKTPAHLHFEIHKPEVGAINPTPLVQEASDAGRRVPVADLVSSPEGRAAWDATIDQWYSELLGRAPTEMERFAWADRLDIGFATAEDLIADLTMAKSRRDQAGPIVRAFVVVLNRRPTLNEITQWESAIANGMDERVLATTLVGSGPFVAQHGELSDEQFITVLHRNATGRDPESTHVEDWLAQFAAGAERAALAEHWADSYEVKDSTWHELEVVQAYRAAAGRMPNDAEFSAWVTHLDNGGLIDDVVADIRLGATGNEDRSATDQAASATEQPAEADG